MYTLSTTAVATPSALIADTNQKKIGPELYIGLQTTQSYPLVGVANGAVLSDTNKAVACLFCNNSNEDVTIDYLDFSANSNTWIRAYVQAGKELPHIIRAVKRVTAGNFIDGQMLRF